MIRDKEIFSTILEKYYSDMTLAEKRVADYLLANPHESITLSVATLARQAETSEATVVRFAKTIGFSGYLELKAELLRRVSKDLAAPQRGASYAHGLAPDTLLGRIADREVANISETLSNIHLDKFEAFARALGTSKVIYTLGSGMSSHFARMASYQLTLLGKRSFCLSDSAASYEDQLALASGSQDFLWLFSFPPYSHSVLDAGRHAVDKKLEVGAITDRLQSPVSQFAQHVLCAANTNQLPINSASATVVLTTALLSEMQLSHL